MRNWRFYEKYNATSQQLLLNCRGWIFWVIVCMFIVYWSLLCLYFLLEDSITFLTKKLFISGKKILRSGMICNQKNEIKIGTPNVGLEPTTLRLRVSCSTDWASRAIVTSKCVEYNFSMSAEREFWRLIFGAKSCPCGLLVVFKDAVMYIVVIVDTR